MSNTKTFVPYYKNIGEIPKGWQLKPFGELFEFLNTSPLTRDNLTDQKTKADIRCIHYGDIHATFTSEILDLNKTNNLPAVKDEIEVSPRADLLKDGDLIIADVSEDYAGVGECVEIINVGKNKVIAGLHTIVARDKDKETIDGFRCYIFRHPKVSKWLKAIATGSSVYGISEKHIANIEIPLPTPNEQKDIAKVLSAFDHAIEIHEKLIRLKEKRNRDFANQLLNCKKRIKGFTDTWESKRIKAFASVVAGGTPSTLRDDYWGGNIKWMNSGELNNKIIYDVEGRITESGLSNSNARLIPIKSTLIGLAGQGKTRGTVAMNMIELCTNQSIAAILPNNAYCPEFLYYNLDSRYDELRSLSTGDGGRGGLNLNIIKNIPVFFPRLIKEQMAIVSILQAADNEIKLHTNIICSLRKHKKALMRQLLTGK